MDSKTSTTGLATVLRLSCLSVVIATLSACNTVSQQAQPQTSEAIQHNSAAEIDAYSQRAFDELDGKPRARPTAATAAQANPPVAARSSSSPAIAMLDKEPHWVMTPPQPDDWLYGVGSAGINSTAAVASQVADDQAKANLAANLRLSISAVNQASEELNSGVVSQSFSSEVRNTVKPVSLTGLNIRERYIDEGQQTVFSLAVLNRQQALDNIAQQITVIDNDLQRISSQLHQGNALQRLRRAIPALKQLELRKQLNQKALDISGGQQLFALPGSLSSLKPQINQLLDNLRFAVSSNGNDILRTGLVQALTQQGMRIRPASEADITLHYAVDWRSLERSGKFYQFANATVTLKDQQGSTLSNFQQKSKGVSSDLGLAQDKALSKLADSLGKRLAASLFTAIQ